MCTTSSTSRPARAAFSRQRVLLAALILLIPLLTPSDGYLGDARAAVAINRAIGPHSFGLVAWEVQALAQKGRDLALRPGAELSPEAQHDLVSAYFTGIADIENLNGEIEFIYADPTRSAPPEMAAAPLQARLDALRAEQEARRPAVEGIIQAQIAAALQEASLLTLGRMLPPVRFQFTASPANLIISPRDRIVVQDTMLLDPGLAVAEMQHIEEQLAANLDVSALVEGTGGIGSYPTMVLELPSLTWTLSTVAHEWVHNYLMFHPLGWHYFDNGDMRTINETVASIVGDEIGALALARSYPERVPKPQPPAPAGSPPPPATFQFGPFMRATRLEADRLLAAGQISEAEAYMEARRQELVAQGYLIRKLNQAYFAFHGSYAVGSAATDPIGDKLRTLRGRAGSLAEFLRRVEGISSAAGLDEVLAKP